MNADTQSTDLRPGAERAEVVAWRLGRLLESGFDLPLADELADDTRFDLHDLIDLVERGCPPEVAARILEPLDRQRRG